MLTYFFICAIIIVYYKFIIHKEVDAMSRTSLSYSMEKHYKELAESNLIRQQRCARQKTTEFSHICYGADLNLLDESRRWLFEEGLAHNMGVEGARIFANKLVLYVNEAELQAEYERLLHSEFATA